MWASICMRSTYSYTQKTKTKAQIAGGELKPLPWNIKVKWHQQNEMEGGKRRHHWRWWDCSCKPVWWLTAYQVVQHNTHTDHSEDKTSSNRTSHWPQSPLLESSVLVCVFALSSMKLTQETTLRFLTWCYHLINPSIPFNSCCCGRQEGFYSRVEGHRRIRLCSLPAWSSLWMLYCIVGYCC